MACSGASASGFHREVSVTSRLVVSFGRMGYLALYRFLPMRNEVRILAIRHQRELDYLP